MRVYNFNTAYFAMLCSCSDDLYYYFFFSKLDILRGSRTSIADRRLKITICFSNEYNSSRLPLIKSSNLISYVADNLVLFEKKRALDHC